MTGEAFWIPAVVAALGAGGEFVNQRNASQRQDNATAQGIMNQQKLESEAAGMAGKTTRDIARSDPNKIAAKSTGDYVAQLRRNAAGGSESDPLKSALAPVAGASSRYNADKATAQTAVSNYGNEQAGQLGQIDAAVRQRQNEGGLMQTLQTSLNGVGARSQTQQYLDQLRAQQAGQKNPWVTLGSKLLMSGAAAYAGGAGPGFDPNGVGSLASAQSILPPLP